MFDDGEKIVSLGAPTQSMKKKMFGFRCKLAQIRKIFTLVKIKDCLAMEVISYNYKGFRV